MPRYSSDRRCCKIIAQLGRSGGSAKASQRVGRICHAHATIRIGRGRLAGSALAGSGWPRLSESRAAGAAVTPGVPAGIVDAATLETLPGKKPLIRLSYRPPNYEFPLDYFRNPITLYG